MKPDGGIRHPVPRRFLLMGEDRLSWRMLGEWLRIRGHPVLVTSCDGDGEAMLGQFDPDVIVISLSDHEAGCAIAQHIRMMSIGDMYVLVALGPCSLAAAGPDFDIVIPELRCHAHLLDALHDLEEAWTVCLPAQLSPQAYRCADQDADTVSPLPAPFKAMPLQAPAPPN